nr:PREDICTED: pre-rRNA-processing protein TSR1 homolog [Lepisosteus oculatus]
MAAAGEQQQAHRAGIYKQKNKQHKHGKHRTKGEIERENKGRVAVKALSRKQRKALKKLDRRHKASQLRRNKKDTVRLNVSAPETVLDVAKVVDTLLFVLDPVEGWDSYGDYCLSCLFAQGLPSHALVCQGVAALPMKKRTDARRALGRLVEARFPDGRLLSLDTPQEAVLLLRHLGSQKQRQLAYRSRRPYLLAQRASFAPGPGGLGTLQVSGYVRGRPLGVNRLVHIAGHGDFQLSQIDAPQDPLPLSTREHPPGKEGDMETKEGGAVGEMEQEVKVLMKADPARQESLEAEAALDPMDGEQTWPTESELQEAEERQRKVRKVPKGTSDYQASWILEEGGSEEDDEESSDEDGDEGMEALEEEEEEEEEAGSQDGEGSAGEGSDSETETLELGQGGPEQRYDDRMDEQEESEALRRYREARADQMFPDEVDTPLDTPARTRFQRYRGLKSFRSSPWDPLENLPPDYARIFQFQNFERTRRRVLVEAAEEEEGAMVGWYVTLHVQDVPPSVMDSFRSGRPLVLVSLLPHEQKMSVLHMLVQRHPGNSEPVKSKEELVFQCGFRRFRASPIFSQHTSGTGLRSAEPRESAGPRSRPVLSPVPFGKLFLAGMQDLIATGSLLKADPQRVVVKRIVLSGHPFKIVRRTAVVRYMFFNRDDVNWFRPVELRTKWGRRGHIKEALGTHGHMKCVFDKQLPSQDTVLMTLYKRVFPRWTYDPHVPQPLPWVKSEETVGTEDIDMD